MLIFGKTKNDGNYEKDLFASGDDVVLFLLQRKAGENRIVKTFFVTHFSVLGRSRNGEPAERGYRYREPCVNRWIMNVDADSLSDDELDAVSDATPQGGLQTFTWDFTDQNGQTVPAGEYTVYVQANLHDWTVKTFACKLPKNVKAGVMEFTEDYQNPDTRYEGMITDVKFEAK